MEIGGDVPPKLAPRGDHVALLHGQGDKPAFLLVLLLLALLDLIFVLQFQSPRLEYDHGMEEA